MKIKELIAELKKYPEDTPVLIDTREMWYWQVGDIMEIGYVRDNIGRVFVSKYEEGVLIVI